MHPAPVFMKVVAATAGLLTGGVLVLAAVAGAAEADGPSCSFAASSADVRLAQPVADVPLSQEQVRNAQTIVAVGHTLGMPPRAYVVAVATALQESRLRNLSYGDRDSLGLFQQRPSQGWGTPAQVRDPEYAAARFYQGLDRVPGWELLPLTVAAQAVQRSAFPDAYARWEPLAASLVDAGASAEGSCTGFDGDGLPRASGSLSGIGPPATYSIPPGRGPAVETAISFALAQVGKPYRFGGRGPDAYDCSSLLQAAFGYVGVEVGPTTLQQRYDGQAVWPPSHVHPGDLVFVPGALGTRSVPRHVGMYIGEGLVVHAPGSGDVVRVAALDDWFSEIVAVRRVVP
jgi:cell wall-associated NlpC family hydrolase